MNGILFTVVVIFEKTDNSFDLLICVKNLTLVVLIAEGCQF